MKRNPIDQFLKDPDNKAKLFVWMTYAMIITLSYFLQSENYFQLFHIIL